MFGLFKKNKPGKAYDGPPLDPEWARNKRGKFHRLNTLEGVAEGLGGFRAVYCGLALRRKAGLGLCRSHK